MSKQSSILSKGRNFNAKLVRHCCRFWQQSRTLLRHCCWCGPGLTQSIMLRPSLCGWLRALAFYRWTLQAGARRRLNGWSSTALRRARRCISATAPPQVARRSRHLGTSSSRCLERWRSSRSMPFRCRWLEQIAVSLQRFHCHARDVHTVSRKVFRAIRLYTENILRADFFIIAMCYYKNDYFHRYRII